MCEYDLDRRVIIRFYGRGLKDFKIYFNEKHFLCSVELPGSMFRELFNYLPG